MVCAPGETAPCTCPVTGTGVATCADDGSGFGACFDCGAAWSRRFFSVFPPAVTADDRVVAAVGLSNDTFDRALIGLDPKGNEMFDGKFDAEGWATCDASGSMVLVALLHPGNSDVLGQGILSPDTSPRFGVMVTPGWDGVAGSATVYAPWTLGLADDATSERSAAPGKGLAADGSFAVSIGVEITQSGSSVTRGALVARRQTPWTPSTFTPWSRVLTGGAGAGSIATQSASIRADGAIVASGVVQGDLDAGDGPVPSLVAPPESDGFVTMFSPIGDVVFERLLGATPVSFARGVDTAIEADGSVDVVADVHDLVSFGGGLVGALGGDAVVLARLGPGGEHLWSRTIILTPTSFRPPVVAPEPAGGLWVCATVDGAALVEGAPPAVAGGTDVLLLRYDADGNLIQQRTFGGPGADACSAIAVGVSGVPIIAGTFAETIDFGQEPLVTQDGEHGFLAKLGPG